MATVKTEVSVGEWENRAELDYVPANEPVPGAGFYASLSANRETAESGQTLTVKEGPTPEESTADMKPCVWDPGTPGVWQWEEVE